ncbi:restriction endonuclease subunit S [Capnocytophaga sputigena]|uniref:restriction endonuclease subunit S n=1 Tax=Capnocytophaga sputigena TaxID=1019 RepID=UPI0028E2794F|nr:restriction endonuclease subunit S [Capnocytophaga sputigena]
MSKVPKLRFPEFEGEWEEKELGDVGEFIGGGTPNTSIPEYWDGEISWYTPTEIKEDRYLLKESRRKITELGLKSSSAKLLPKGSLLITTRATIGDVAIVNEPCATNQGFQSLVVKENQINRFWFYWIIKNRELLIKKASGSTFKEIAKNEIIKIGTIVPQKKEQQKIADCLLSLDELIEARREKIASLKAYKKGLLQRLFPEEVSKSTPPPTDIQQVNKTTI